MNDLTPKQQVAYARIKEALLSMDKTKPRQSKAAVVKIWAWRVSFALKEAYPHARIVVGNSEVGIEQRYKNDKNAAFLAAGAVPELRTCADSKDGMVFGACAPLSDVEKLCHEAAEKRGGAAAEGLCGVCGVRGEARGAADTEPLAAAAATHGGRNCGGAGRVAHPQW